MPDTSLKLCFDGGNYEVPADKMFIVGRGSSSDLQIRNPLISRRHAVIWYKNGWLVEDLSTTNGTFSDHRQIERKVINEEMLIRLGDPQSGPELQLIPVKSSSPSPVSISSQAKEIAAILARADAPPLLQKPGQISTQPSDPVSRILERMDAPPLLSVPEDAYNLQRESLGINPYTSGGLQVRNLSYRVESGKQLLRNISLDAPRGTLTAVVGPSGAGKSTFAKAVSGLTKPFIGQAAFDGIDIHKDYDKAKSFIGMVPQEDVIHRQLTVPKALEFASQLRLDGTYGRLERRAQVDKVVGQLNLEAHLDTRISRLSGGQRKRASVALELLTEPSFLILDEPTSGLDPALDRQLMAEFRTLADGGRSVLVITHSVACLDMCDQVLVLVPGGATGFLGSEAKAFEYFGTDDWSDIFTLLKDDPAGCEERWQASGLALTTATSVIKDAVVDKMKPRRVLPLPQLLTLVRRQFALMLADKGYSLFLLALPFVIGLLPAVVPGEVGLTQVHEMKNSQEPRTILALLIIGAIFIGISMSIRELVSERTIYERERAVGLSPGAYLASKVLVYNLLAAFGAIVIVRFMGLTKELPTGEGVLGLGAANELTIAIFATISIGISLGLLLSSFVRSQQQVMPVLIVILMAQMVLNGGLISLVDNDALNAASKTVPARWSFALGAASIDLEQLLELPESPPVSSTDLPPQSNAEEASSDEATSSGEDDEQTDEEYAGVDEMWESTRTSWAVSMAVLSLMAVLLIVSSWFRVRRIGKL